MGIIILVVLLVVAVVAFVLSHRSSIPASDRSSEIFGPTRQARPTSEEKSSAVFEPPISSVSTLSPSIVSIPSKPEIHKAVDLSLAPPQFVVLDLETTGLSPNENEIIEIGAIRVNRDSDQHAAFQVLVKPTERVPKNITKMTGITQFMVDRDGLSLAEAVAQFKKFIGDLPLVSFNASFDMAFIWKAANRHGIPINNRFTCALKLARRAYPGLPSYRLVDLARMGNLSDENTHRAIGDCMRTIPIFLGSLTKIGERILWDVPKVDWRISVQYHEKRDSNRAFVAETRPLEASDPELAVVRYREALARMYEYEKLIYNYHGDDHLIDRLSLVLSRLGRFEEVIECVDEFIQKFPEAHSSVMTGVLRRKEKAESNLLLTVQ